MLKPLVGTLDTRIAKPPPKTVDPFYLTPEYRRWRALVVARAGYKCQDCGNPGYLFRLYADHIVEIKDGGAPLDPANGRCRCASCHTTKTNTARAARQAQRYR